MCGPHATVDNGKDKPFIAPVINKPFVARNGGEYEYDNNGCLRGYKLASRRDVIRNAGGKAAYYRQLDELRMLSAEQN